MKIRRYFGIFATFLCMSSVPNAQSTNDVLYQSKVFDGKSISNVVKCCSNGEKTFTVESAKKDWMTKNTITWECLEMNQLTIYQPPIHTRVINTKMTIEINPSKIKHQVDAFGWMNPEDPVRLKWFGLEFQLGQAFSKRGKLIYTSSDDCFGNDKNHEGSIDNCYYNGKLLNNGEDVLVPVATYYAFLPLSFYGAGAVSSQNESYLSLPGDRFQLLVNNYLSTNSKSFQALWTFNSDDQYKSDSGSESQRMYASNLEKTMHEGTDAECGNEPLNYYHPSTNAISFYYSFAFGDESYSEKMTMKFSSFAEVGYGVIGSANEREGANTGEIEIKLN